MSKKSKKGFTLIESIIAIAIFVMIGGLISIIAVVGSNFLNKSNKVTYDRHQLKQSISAGRSYVENNVINNNDDDLYIGDQTVANGRGKAEIKGRIIINTKDAIVVGPSKYTSNERGKTIVKKASEINNDIDNLENSDDEIELITSTVYDSDGKPRETLSKGVIKK